MLIDVLFKGLIAAALKKILVSQQTHILSCSSVHITLDNN